MNRFIVISPNAEQIATVVQRHFPDFNYPISPGVWAVAGTSTGPSEVSEILGIDRKGTHSGIVFALDSYYGFYDPSLWEKLNFWEEQ